MSTIDILNFIKPHRYVQHKTRSTVTDVVRSVPVFGKTCAATQKRKKSGILDFEKKTQENVKNVRTVSEGIQLAKVSTGKSPTSNIFAQECGRTVHIHKKLCNLELCVINE